MGPFQILGLGTSLPAHWITQSEAAEFAVTCLTESDGGRRSSLAGIRTLYRRAGVATRHSVVLTSSSAATPAAQDFYWTAETAEERGPGTAARMQRYEQEAPRLAIPAVHRALDQAALRPQQITHLITVSCSGFSAPGVDLQLMRSVGLSADVARTHVGFMGCHGVLNGLRVARSFAASDPAAIVLVCAVELCSLHHQYGDNLQEIVANSLFADGAAAVVGRAEPAATITQVSRAAAGLPGSVVDHFCSVVPDTEQLMTWRIADAGFRMTLSPEVPGVITANLAPAMDRFLARNSLRREQIASWAIHPGGPRILSACAEALELTDEQLEPSRAILSRCGNMSSPTVLFIVEELQQRQARLPCVLLGFGPGLNIEAALLR